MDYKERGQDTRIGRFLSIDPLTSKYAELTPYQFASNSPLMGVDLDGLELLPSNSSVYKMRFMGFVQVMELVDNEYVLVTVPNYTAGIISANVPEAIKGKDGTVVYDVGAPAGVNGEDKPGPYFYVNSSPDFNFKTSDIGKPYPNQTDPDASPSSMQYKFYKLKDGQKYNWTKIQGGSQSGVDAGKQIYGMGQNYFNKAIWNGIAKVKSDKRAFYLATQMVNKSKMITFEFSTGKGKADLINYITDGAFPSSYNLFTESKTDIVKNTGYMLRLMSNADKVMKENKKTLRKDEYEKNGSIYKMYVENGGK
ncbi:MAG: hypothetical protein WC756_06710 [Taibaiella sp.]|jgi:hypothetical protein